MSYAINGVKSIAENHNKGIRDRTVHWNRSEKQCYLEFSSYTVWVNNYVRVVGILDVSLR